MASTGSDTNTKRKTCFILACPARFVVLILHLAAGLRFKAHQQAANVTGFDTEHHGLLVPLNVGEHDGQEVHPALGQQQDRRNQNRLGHPAFHFLAILHAVHAGIRDVQARALRGEHQIVIIRKFDCDFGFVNQSGAGSAHIVDPRAWCARLKQRQERQQQTDGLGHCASTRECSPAG